MPVFLFCLALAAPALADPADPAAEPPVDFNREIRSILSNNCFTCHGPDDSERQAGLRLDQPAEALAELDSGLRAIVPGQPDQSELLARVRHEDPDLRMPPADSGKKLTPAEIELLTRWIRQGAKYSRHWSYVPPVRPPLPAVGSAAWPRNEIDYFILSELERRGLRPAPATDRAALIRRVSLDLIGLPPTLDEVRRFEQDSDPKVYERLVDRLLDHPAYGEHWARMWLDLARYADSAGYADDPPRTIWAYRDYVIRSLNANKPFDQFTVEQLAGDLLPDPAPDQLIATAFHRNTLTNNEGGTNDEEFRNVAIVDRVNTTLAVWMGTTVSCAQCHNHKYDPISQQEFFQLFAIWNNTADADRRDESPLLEIWSDQQQRQKADWQAEIERLQEQLATATPELLAEQSAWERQLAAAPQWHAWRPAEVRLESGAAASIADDASVLVPQAQPTDTYSVELPVETPAGDGQPGRWTALRLEALDHDSLPGRGPGHAGGNFVVTRVLARIAPPAGQRPSGRYVRIELPGEQKILSLAEVQVFSGDENLAQAGEATQSSTAFDGPSHLAIDGKTDGNYTAGTTTHTATEANPWWEVDLGSTQPLDRIVVWNRTDNGLHTRLKDFRVRLLDEQRQMVWEQAVVESPNPQVDLTLSGVRPVALVAAYADHTQAGFAADAVLDGKEPDKSGWAIGPQLGQAHHLTLIPQTPLELPAGSRLIVTIEQRSQHENHTLGRFRLSGTTAEQVSQFAALPAEIVRILAVPAEQRSDEQTRQLTTHYLSIAPRLQPQRQRLAALTKQLAEAKPETTVPIMRRLPDNQLRVTRIQRRGNFLELGDEVQPGVPTALHAWPEGLEANRLGLARWLIDPANPLTARVIVNRYWEAIFGQGLVLTSEEFGSQGDLPSHPELLDWLATELVAHHWDLKHLLKKLVLSATYQQSSKVTGELLERDPENRWLARGPRYRLSAEMVRDQALFVSGLLSDKMYGPPVKPPQPAVGLSAAFGSGIDWQTSQGDDRYRRALYTTWRRSNPYPSMVAFDAPNREVCTVRRSQTNTPLQALVTLNDPVYVEAAQALARRIEAAGDSPDEKLVFGFRLCLAREPSEAERASLTRLYEQARQRFAADAEAARHMATQPLGPAPEGSDIASLAAWTVVGNVLLNLDEMFMKR
ncbi:MAG: DUF1553 domain-containing protein [Pirellulaceae bacterium]|nr:DUF1553 domain-containing protein [Pirellulaceae bacterium]